MSTPTFARTPSPPAPDRGHARSRRAARRVLSAVVVVALTVPLAACGVHLAKDGAPPLVPTGDESVRAATVAEITTVGRLARDAAATKVSTAVRAQLQHVEQLAGQQVVALGGVYAGPAPTTRPTDTDGSGVTPAPRTSTPTARPATVAGVVAQLAANESAERGRLAGSREPGLARLVAQVATSQDLSARALARAANLAAPSAQPSAKVPTQRPDATHQRSLDVLVASEDAAGYALEVEAARTKGSARSALSARAAVHRARGQAWALASGLASTADDPRTTAYALPKGSVTAVRRTLESGLAARYAQALDSTGPASRTAIADLLTDSARAAVDAGAPITALPGDAS